MAALLTAAAPAHAQEDTEPVEVSDPIRIYVFAEAERAEVPVGWSESSSGTRSRRYRYDAEQAQTSVEALARQLARGDRRQELIMVVDTEDQADLIVEIVGTEILHQFTGRGATNRDDRFGPEPLEQTAAAADTERLGSRIDQASREPVILAELRVRNHEFTMNLTGRQRGSVLLSPAVVLGATMEEWVEQNYASLLQLIYGM